MLRSRLVTRAAGSLLAGWLAPSSTWPHSSMGNGIENASATSPAPSPLTVPAPGLTYAPVPYQQVRSFRLALRIDRYIDGRNYGVIEFHCPFCGHDLSVQIESAVVAEPDIRNCHFICGACGADGRLDVVGYAPNPTQEMPAAWPGSRAYPLIHRLEQVLQQECSEERL